MLINCFAILSFLSGIVIPATEHITTTSAQQVLITEGEYQLGSDNEERDWAYQNSPELVRQQRWYDLWEHSQGNHKLNSFWLDRYPVTQKQYALFVKATGHRAPYISAQDYHRQGFLVHDYAVVSHYLWQNKQPPAKRANHPVVLVSWSDAQSYCKWKGMRLPRENEWEAACRGTQGHRFPWGNQWSALNSHHQAEGTASVYSHPGGASSNGAMDMLGNVFEWTESTFNNEKNQQARGIKDQDSSHKTLRSCSWDDAPGTCHCGFRHGRAAQSRHILIGFRCAKAIEQEKK